MKFVDHYKILGITENATLDEIKKSFRELAKKYHPDKNNADDANDRFREIFTAYEILKNTENRKYFDHERKKYYGAIRDSAIQETFNEEHFNNAKKQARENADKYSKMSFADFLESSIFVVKKATLSVALVLMFLFGGFMIIFGLYSLTMASNNGSGVGVFIMLFSFAFGGLLIYIAQKDYAAKQNLDND